MIKEATGKGATLEEARENAIAALNARDDDDIQFEVVSEPKKKVLGLFGGSDAVVRVYVELPDPKPKKKPQNNKKNADRKPNAEKVEKTEKTVKEPAQKPEKTAKQPTTVAEDYKDAVDVSSLAEDSSARRAVDYLTMILTQLGCTNITAKVAEKENGAFIVLDGDDLSAVIGHRGETLDALQYLAGLAANNNGGYYKVSLNIGNYREKREQTLIALANRISEQVLRTNRSRSLEPMNPYERRIIHTAVQGIDGVVSNSFGEGSNRRVVIAPEGGDIRPPRREGGRDGRRGGRGGRGGRDRRPSNTVNAAPTREPKKDSDMPLYGKIN